MIYETHAYIMSLVSYETIGNLIAENVTR